MRCLQKPYCARERGHEGVCLDGAALTAANLCTRVAELERIAEQWREERDLAEKARDALRAEVERLRDLFAAEQKATHAALTRDADQIERLREALRQVLSEYDDNDEGPTMRTMMLARAALAGSPVETRLPVDDEAEARFEKLLAKRRAKAEAWLNQGPEVSGTLAFHAEPVETRRALAERVREACVEAVVNTAAFSQPVPAIRALDLDALLEEP